MISPFTYLPTDVCNDLDVPDFPVEQDCADYAQLRSEVWGVIIRPISSTYPIAWYNLTEWYTGSKIDNEDPTKAHFIAGKGSFLPTEKVVATLAGGRVEENRERTQRLILNVSTMNAGLSGFNVAHTKFGRQLQRNKKDFTFNVVTIGGLYMGSSNMITHSRVIGGYLGMQPVSVDAIFGFQEGANSRESMQLIIDTEFLDFPDMPLPT